MDKKDLIRHLANLKDNYGDDCPHERFDRVVIEESIAYIEKAPVAKSPAAMAGSAANAATLKVKISGILMDAIGGHKEKYRTPEGFIRWGVVEGDINETIDAALR